MPFTLSHAALAIPLRRWLPLDALMIGSMAPDFEYLVRLEPRGSYGHMFPWGLGLTVPWALLVLSGWRALLPSLCRCLGLSPPVVPVAGLRSSITGVSVGILGHLAWDLLTHRCSDGIAFLEVPAFAGLPLYRILQHASSLVGLGFCLASMRGWLRAQASGFQRSLARLLAWVQVVALPAGFLNGSLAETYRERAGRFATAWLAGMVVALVACVLLRAWRSARSGESGRWPSREPQQRAAAQVRPRDGACGDGAGTRRRIRP